MLYGIRVNLHQLINALKTCDSKTSHLQIFKLRSFVEQQIK